MSSDDIENAIRCNITWSRLPDDLRVILGGSQREYDKLVVDYSIRNQLRYKDNIVRFVKKSEEDYYESLLAYSQSRMMLYPYHLSDIMVRGLRVTPFTYYNNMLADVMQAEKSYDSLPNFTAADAMRILGIGRNQYIDLMNVNRSNKKLFRRSKSTKEILPQKPVDNISIEPWYLLCYGCILENDIRLLTPVEKEVIDRLMDFGPITCCEIDKSILVKLISRGLVYLDVPIKDDDYFYVPTLDGFVMNRVQGDYFETLLYKIFVTIDGQTTVKELSDTINMDIVLVKNAISVFCRLGFAKKRHVCLENLPMHRSWIENGSNQPAAGGLNSPLSPLSEAITISTDPVDLTDSFSVAMDDDDELLTSVENLLAEDICFRSLKNHAVTLFEVGKLSDEAVDSFIDELQNVILYYYAKRAYRRVCVAKEGSVNFFVEGEAHRYSEHAKTLLHTIQALRISNEMDLIRGESLWNLDENARIRVMQKSYKLLVSMGPMNAEACSIPLSVTPLLGTPTVEIVSAWFRLYLYNAVQSGPSSIFLPMGCRLARLPLLFWKSRRLIMTQGTHEPVIFSTENSLVAINEALQCSPVLIQAYSESIDDNEIANVPFSFKNCPELSDPTSFYNHPAVQKLRNLLQLDTLCGYVVLLKLHNCSSITFTRRREATNSEDPISESCASEEESFMLGSGSMTMKLNNHNSSVSKDPRKICSFQTHLRHGESFSDYVLFDCVFGIPLFDEQLNKIVCYRIVQNNLMSSENFDNIKFAVQSLVSSTRDFVKRFQDDYSSNHFPGFKQEGIPHPISAIYFDASTNMCKADIDNY